MISDVLLGDCMTVLENLPQKSIDTVFTCPSPFRYYDDQPTWIGGQHRLVDYIKDLINICNKCKNVLKESGNLFIQIGDQYTPQLDLAGIPSTFEHFMRMNGWLLSDRLIWHRTETKKRKYNEYGFLKNYEFIFHFVLDIDKFYFNTKSRYISSSILSYPLEYTYYTEDFDSGLPKELTEIIIDTTVPVNGTIMDPLCGSAKVGVVAKKMQRNFIGIDIDPQVVDLCKIRLGLLH